MKNDHLDVDRLRAELMAAVLPHVPFDGWSAPAFAAAVADLGVDPGLAKVVCPRGALDLAVEYHRAGDRAMVAALAAEDLSGLKFRDRVARAVRLRLEAVDPELVRRGAAVFALPQNAATGAGLIWGTADAIWLALGDTSRDYNYYSKRMTLAGVYSAVVLYWMGDESEGHAASWAFLEARIGDVMQFEKIKGGVMKVPFVKSLLSGIRAPEPAPMPGRSGGASQ
ncbi:MAG: COQ9 family protein [Sphingomonadales bacterium]|nr:COQ9 family protein [Sphingomonadales bacterium]